MSAPAPRRGDVWYADLDPVRGHEQGGRRPVVIVSANLLNEGPGGLVMVVPLTSRDRGLNAHIRVVPPQGGLRVVSFATCDNVRTISRDRLAGKLGSVGAEVLDEISGTLAILLDLG